ncbi:MAG TPA: HEAT repeat domain-containing protein [Kofleriaceae bacterium]|nr:HEAT repeat domain-containing protein [Kofleriaceae bacterium]
MLRSALGVVLVLTAASCRPREPRADHAAAPTGRGDAAPASASSRTFGKEMTAVDDLATDNIRDITRKYRPLGLDVVDVMVAAMRGDPRPRVRANAVSIVFDACYFAGHLDTALPYLLEALGDPDPDVESRAADVLAGWYLDHSGVRTAVTEHVPRLNAATSSTDRIVQAHAVSALEKLGQRPPAASMLHAQNGAIRQRGVTQALAAHDVEAVPLLVELARTDPELVVRVDAIAAVAELAAAGVRDPLLAALFDDPSDPVAAAAMRAAGTAKAAALAGDLRRVLTAPENNRTDTAIAALTALGDKPAVPAIAAHLGDRGSDAKWNAKLALDALVGETRSLPDWQQWARSQGYLK